MRPAAKVVEHHPEHGDAKWVAKDHGNAEPADQLEEVVGTANETKEASGRDLVPSLGVKRVMR